MKILRLISAGYEQGGVENGLVLTNKLLKLKGHDIKVISSTYRPDLKHYSDFEFKSIPSSGIKMIPNTAFNISAYIVTRQVLKTYKPDVVLLHTMTQQTAAVYFLLKNYPTVQFVHGPEIFTKSLLPWYLSRDNYKNESYNLRDLTLLGKLHYAFFAYICRPLYLLSFQNIDKIVALSGYTQQMLKNEGFKAEYIPNGAQIMNLNPIEPKSNKILYAGRLEKFKGVDDLLRALPKIVKQVPNARLIIAGDGSYADELKALSKKLDIDESVEFLGHLSASQLKKVYEDFSVFVLPSTWPETFGKVGIEAMSVGRPVVATNVGGVKDWLKDNKNGFLVKPHSPDQIAEKVVLLLNDVKLAAKMSKQARKTAERFSIERMSENINAIINELKNSKT